MRSVFDLCCRESIAVNLINAPIILAQIQGARRADTDNRIPCQDIAGARSIPVITPIASVVHVSLNVPISRPFRTRGRTS